MKIKKILKKLFLTVLILVVSLLVVGIGFWLIDGRSPQAFIVAHSLSLTTMEEYENAKVDTTDKSTIDIPDNIVFPREVKQYRVGEMQVFESAAVDDSKPVVLYIHGGAYVHNFTPQHWKAMAEWAETTGCGIVTPNYPLLYRYTVNDAFPLMLQLYQQLQERYSSKRIIIMGDSAGGGFSLALTQKLLNDSIDIPARLVLISPWVDVVGGDDALQEYDTFLNLKVLRLVGADWADGIDPHDPMVSPLYGEMRGLPPTDIYVGTWETLYTDIVNAYDKMKKAAGVDVRLHVKKKMGHVYPLWPCPEGKEARKEIGEIIQRQNSQ